MSLNNPTEPDKVEEALVEENVSKKPAPPAVSPYRRKFAQHTRVDSGDSSGFTTQDSITTDEDGAEPDDSGSPSVSSSDDEDEEAFRLKLKMRTDAVATDEVDETDEIDDEDVEPILNRGPHLRLPNLEAANKSQSLTVTLTGPTNDTNNAPEEPLRKSKLAEKYAAKPLVDPPVRPTSSLQPPSNSDAKEPTRKLERISSLLRSSQNHRASALPTRPVEEIEEEKLGPKLVERTRLQNELRYTLIPIVPVAEGTSIKLPTVQATDDENPAAVVEEKVLPLLVEYTQKQNKDKYPSMMPIKNETFDIDNITSVQITGYDKRYDPDKYYIYNIQVLRGDRVSTIFRRYRQFYDLYQTLLRDFPNVSHPAFPPKILFGRSHVGSVSRARMLKLNEYIQAIVQQKDIFSSSPVFQVFFRSCKEDIDSEIFNNKLAEKGIDFSVKLK